MFLGGAVKVLLDRYQDGVADKKKAHELTERLLADSDYLAREIAALRLALGEAATRDFVRTELRDQVDDIIKALDKHADAQRKARGEEEMSAGDFLKVVRAKAKIRDAGIPYQVPTADELADRLEAEGEPSEFGEKL